MGIRVLRNRGDWPRVERSLVSFNIRLPRSASEDHDRRATIHRGLDRFYLYDQGTIETRIYSLCIIHATTEIFCHSLSLSLVLIFQRLPVPWKSILLSIPVWTIVVTHSCSVFGYFTVVNQLPTYMKYILNFNIKEVRRSLCFPLILFHRLDRAFCFFAERNAVVLAVPW